MRKTYAASTKCSTTGSLLGSLTIVKLIDLGTTVVRAPLEDGEVAPEQADELLCGNVLDVGLGQNIGHQVAFAVEIPESVCSHPVNMACGSRLHTVMEGVMSIQTGSGDTVAAGGVGSMPGAPYLIPTNTHAGNKMGDFECVGHMTYGVLTDTMNGTHISVTAENIVRKYNITREMQDAFGYASQQKAIVAIDSGRLRGEIVPIEVKLRKETIVFDTDEHPNRKSTPEKMTKLRPTFVKDGSITATSASGVNDSAPFVLLAGEEAVEKYNLTPLCEVVSIGQGGVNPLTMGLGPTPTIRNTLEYANMKLDEAKLIELNEAFVAWSSGVVHELAEEHGVDRGALLEKTNMNGGVIASGHPVGTSGNHTLVTLIHEMTKRDAESGLASLCIGGGQGTTVIVRRP